MNISAEVIAAETANLVSAIRGAIARFPEATGWVIESGFRSVYENCAVVVKSIESDKAEFSASFPALTNVRLWKIAGLPIHAETEDSEPQTWASLVRSDGAILATITVEKPRSFVC